MNTRECRFDSRQRGLSLIELMVALAIGAFLVLGVATVFLANKDSARIENSLARLQENARFALDLMREDLHRSQYLGCNTGDVFLINMIDDPNAPGFANSLEGVRGYERNGAGAWGAAPIPPDTNSPWYAQAETVAQPNSGARNGSDVLSVRMTDLLNAEDDLATPAVREDALLTGLVNPASTSVPISDNPDCAIEQGSRVVLTGCNLTAHLFQVTNAQTCNVTTPPNPTTLEFDGTGNFATSINTTYGEIDPNNPIGTPDQVLLFEEAVWFVADTGRDRGGLDVWALYREVNGVRQEMIEGVEHMQIKFGQRVPGGNIRFVDPSDPTLNTGANYEGLISVRIALLLQGFDLVRDAADTRRYVLIDERVSGISDSALDQGGQHAEGPVQRDVFTTTVTLRNAPEI